MRQVPLAGGRIPEAKIVRDLPLAKAYQLLEPGPVVLLATSQAGRPNVMTMSWHMMMEFEPPLIGCVVSAGNFSFTALNETRQCVIAVPSADIADKVVGIGNCSGRDEDKFDRFQLTTKPAKTIGVPLITDCFANLECVVQDDAMVEKYNLFVLEVRKAGVQPGYQLEKTLHHHGWGTFAVDGKTVKLKSAMR